MLEKAAEFDCDVLGPMKALVCLILFMVRLSLEDHITPNIGGRHKSATSNAVDCDGTYLILQILL